MEYIRSIGLWGPVLMFIAVVLYQCTRAYLNHKGYSKAYEDKREGKTRQSDTL